MSVEHDAEARLASLVNTHLREGNVLPFRKPKPKSATRPKPEPAISARVSINGTGNAAVVGSHNSVTINVRGAIKKVVAEVKPGETHITDHEAARLQQLVREVHQRTGKPFQHIWPMLLRKVDAPTYRLIRLEEFTRAESYLLHWIGSTVPADESEAESRARHTRYIKTNQRKMNKPDDELVHFLEKRFGKTGLRECSVDELAIVRNELVARWRHTF
jgi:hypothetical protein